MIANSAGSRALYTPLNVWSPSPRDHNLSMILSGKKEYFIYECIHNSGSKCFTVYPTVGSAGKHVSCSNSMGDGKYNTAYIIASRDFLYLLAPALYLMPNNPLD